MNTAVGLTRFYVRCSLISLVLLTITLCAVHSPAVGQSLNPIMMGFEDGCEGKQHPCWQGVVPGITDLEAAIQRFEDLAFSVSQQVSPQLGHNQYIISDPRNASGCITILIPLEDNRTMLRLICSGLRLGDMMAVFGAPDAAYNGLLYYRFGLILLTHQLSLYSEVEMVYLTLSNPPPVCSAVWRGFAHWWRYQQWAAWEPAC
jgi:hypothetical protein